jgi:hypothetical protein
LHTYTAVPEFLKIIVSDADQYRKEPDVMRILPFFLLLFLLISCAGEQRTAAPPPGRVIGFTGNDVLRVESSGTHSGSGTEEARKREARAHAVAAAKQYLVEIYSGSTISVGSGYQPSSAQWFIRIVENGSVISESFDGEGRCTVVYEIRARDLRDMLHRAVSTH